MKALSPIPARERFAGWVTLIAVILSCLGLFALDHETHSIAALFNPGNLVALLIYALPTYLLCMVIQHFLAKSYSMGTSLILALSVGIPSGLILVMFLLTKLMHRG